LWQKRRSTLNYWLRKFISYSKINSANTLISFSAHWWPKRSHFTTNKWPATNSWNKTRRTDRWVFCSTRCKNCTKRNSPAHFLNWEIRVWPILKLEYLRLLICLRGYLWHIGINCKGLSIGWRRIGWEWREMGRFWQKYKVSSASRISAMCWLLLTDWEQISTSPNRSSLRHPPQSPLINFRLRHHPLKTYAQTTHQASPRCSHNVGNLKKSRANSKPKSRSYNNPRVRI
jgi:hypothetical protein